MIESEVLHEIFTTFKAYIGVVDSNYYYQLRKRYKKGTLSQKTKDWLIKESGYIIEVERKYKKIS